MVLDELPLDPAANSAELPDRGAAGAVGRRRGGRAGRQGRQCGDRQHRGGEALAEVIHGDSWQIPGTRHDVSNQRATGTLASVSTRVDAGAPRVSASADHVARRGLVHRAAPARRARQRRAGIRLLTNPVDRADRAVRRQPVPGRKRQAVVHLDRAGLVPRALRPHGEARDWHERALVFGPDHGRVFDRHAFQRSAQLHPQLPFAAVRGEVFDHRRTQAVGRAAQIDRRVFQRQQFRRDRCDLPLRHVQAVEKRHLAEEGFAEDVGLGVATQALERATLAAHRLDDLLGATQQRGKRALQVGHPVGGGREQLQAAEKLVRRGREKRPPVDEQKVLRHRARAAGQALSLHTDHLEREAARCRHLVVEQVTRRGRQADQRRVGLRCGEQALCIRQRQLEHLQLAAQQAVALGVHASKGLARCP